jgi:hypothetical protein
LDTPVQKRMELDAPTRTRIPQSVWYEDMTRVDNDSQQEQREPHRLVQTTHQDGARA